MDIDLFQYCPRCKKPQLFAEVKKYLITDWEWAQTRMLAKDFMCPAILVVETPDDIGVRVYDPDTGDISPVAWGGEDGLVRVLERARDEHEC